MRRIMKYKVISEQIIKSLVEFLDEVQFDAAGSEDKDSVEKVNVCNWLITELLNSYDAIFKKDDKNIKKPKNKSRDTYVEETFMDWNLPDMSDEDYEKLVDQFDNFLRSWEKEYNKSNPKKKPIKDRKDKEGKEWKPKFSDVVQHCSLDEIKDMLLDDPELTPADRFDLYYTEHERVQKSKIKTYTFDELIKKTKIGRYKEVTKNDKGENNVKDNK